MANKKTATPVSERRLAANRANAQKSTGPKTSEGKAKSSLNAVKNGLTGQTVLLPGEEVEAYHAHVKKITAAFAPVGALEEQVVQTLADLQWRLNRIPSLESGLLALARRRCAPDLFADEPDAQTRAVMLSTHVYDLAEKSIQNLHRQEQRLRRQYAGEIKELERLRRERAKRESSESLERWLDSQQEPQEEDEESEQEQQPEFLQELTPPDGFVLPNVRTYGKESR